VLILVDNLQVYTLTVKLRLLSRCKTRKKHALNKLNKQYVLNSELRLLTRVYGIVQDATY